MSNIPDRNLALELVRVTEAAALNAARWMGRGDKIGADQAAVDGMRAMMDMVTMDGIVVIGEGEKDEAPMLYNGERVGNGQHPDVDVAVDPIDGTRLLSLGRPGSIAVVAIAERGAMYSPGPIVYMDKIAVGPSAKGAINIEASVAENLQSIAEAQDMTVENLTVVVLDRPRHENLIHEIRAAGARIKMITDGDVAGAILAAMEDTGVDVLMGIGGTPEGVITASAMKCMGGDMQGRLWPRNEKERQAALEVGLDLQEVLTLDKLVSGNNVFFAATGITSGELLRGVRYTSNKAYTHSVVMRSRSGTIRYIEANHSLDKLRRIQTGQLIA
ncbi:MAG: class II fructose-bisphosphatase [Chloroflexi bacterium]|nr:class II fructose-bisphosphatase [Chloroflexota bacterium]